MDQARWSRRELARQIASQGHVVLRPLRSAELPPDRVDELDFTFAGDTQGWPLVVVLDHPRLPEFHERLDPDVIVMASRDWVGVMSALRSTSGMLTYLNRCIENRLALDPAIGDEWHRFVALCEADAATYDGGPTWSPWLSFAALEDPASADMYQHIINRCWPIGSPLPAAPLADHRHVAEFLDEVPPGVRVSIGRRWRSYGMATKEGGQASGISLMPGRALFMLMHRSTDGELPPTAMANRLAGIALVRLWELAPLGVRSLVAVGVFTHPGATDYVFVLVEDTEAPDDHLVNLVHGDIGRLSLPYGIDRLRA